mgnify:FL=1
MATKININPAIDLTTANSNKAAESNKEQYKSVAKAAFFYNAGRKNKSKSAAYESYVAKKQNAAKKEPAFSNTKKPLNSKEKEMIAQKMDIKSEIEDANTSSQWLSENAGIQVVNKEDESSSKGIPKLTKTTNNGEDEDKTKRYIENDLGKGKTTKNNRAAKNILDELIDNDSSDKPKRVEDYNLISGNSKIKQNFDKTKTKKNPDDSIKSLPNAVKLLLKSNAKNYPPNKSGGVKKEVKEMLSEDVNPENEDMFRYKFQEIVEVQVLREYEKAIHGYSLMLPKWEKLTKEIYEQTLGKNLICRIVPYENSVMGIKRDKNYDLPTYDEYFILINSLRIIQIIYCMNYFINLRIC